ncbi:hypothetical protein [Amycolatopsis sp. NPDC004079]|uniref:hypothetical protein n=1 Tax=Amycolatopsis sp. NPDC004079 TaxID=3154549 RepID=UPI0033B11E34
MTEDMPAAPVPDKVRALARLTQLREWAERRDELVCDAQRARATYAEIMAASGLAKHTISAILGRAGLTGDRPAHPEDTMLAAALSVDYPHQPHFVRVEPAPEGDHANILCRYLNRSGMTPTPRVKFTFEAFTGDEPEPLLPSIADLDRASAMRNEAPFASALCETEWRVARDLWRLARHTRRLLPVLDDAAVVWTRYDHARDTMNRLYRGLGTTAKWNQAVMRLLDAQENALNEAEDWGRVSRLIAEAEDQKHLFFPSFTVLASQHGIDEHASLWQLDPDARATVESTIRAQKHRLREIRELSGTDSEADRT